MEHLEGVRDRGEALLGLQRQPRVRRRHLDAQRCRVLRGEGGEKLARACRRHHQGRAPGRDERVCEDGALGLRQRGEPRHLDGALDFAARGAGACSYARVFGLPGSVAAHEVRRPRHGQLKRRAA